MDDQKFIKIIIYATHINEQARCRAQDVDRGGGSAGRGPGARPPVSCAKCHVVASHRTDPWEVA